MISEEEKLAVVKMFCAYCRRTLRNARTDIIRKQAREARWETVFSDMHESELNRLASPDDLISEEVVFEVVGRGGRGDGHRSRRCHPWPLQRRPSHRPALLLRRVDGQAHRRGAGVPSLHGPIQALEGAPRAEDAFRGGDWR